MLVIVFAILAGLIVLGLLIALIWRLASRRETIPCPAWLGWMVEMDNPFTETNRAATIISHLDLEPGMSVLDFGCGPGRLTLPLAQGVGPQGQVLAVDIQPAMLSRARAKAAGLENVRFLQAAAGEDKLGQALFDRAVLVTVLGEIPGQQTALQEIYTALKPGGWLSVTEIVFDPHFQTRAHVLRLATELGLREHEYFGNRLAYTLNLEKPAAA